MAGLISGSWKKSYSNDDSSLFTCTPYCRCSASFAQSSPKKPCDHRQPLSATATAASTFNTAFQDQPHQYPFRKSRKFTKQQRHVSVWLRRGREGVRGGHALKQSQVRVPFCAEMQLPRPLQFMGQLYLEMDSV